MGRAMHVFCTAVKPVSPCKAINSSCCGRGKWASPIMCHFVGLQGEASEGMILAGVLTDSSLPNGELVAPIRPPGARSQLLAS